MVATVAPCRAFKNDRAMKQKKLCGHRTIDLGLDELQTQISNFKCFFNDILSDIIVIKAVTEKTVRNLNLNFKFLSNGNFR